ncbi:MAG: ribonuclease-3 [Myxococcota bacterium]|jgi:ribonuclease-3
MSDLAPLEAKLGYTFKNPKLAHRALTHKSWVEEGGEGPHQERLEFLGDAFLGYVIAQHLFDICAEDAADPLTPKRAAQVEGANLKRVAESLGLEALLRVGVEAGKDLGLNNRAMEDTLEALFGAIMTDGSATDARGVIQRLLLNNLDLSTESRHSTSVYNERWSKQFREAPPEIEYRVEGPENSRTYWATVKLPSGKTVEGEASRSKGGARQSAHAAALRKWPSVAAEA